MLQPQAPKVATGLCEMNGLESPNRFQLNKDDTIDHDIGAVMTNDLSSIPDSKLNLIGNGDASFPKFDQKGLFVYRLEIAWSQFAMNGNRRANDFIGEFLMFHGAASLAQL